LLRPRQALDRLAAKRDEMLRARHKLPVLFSRLAYEVLDWSFDNWIKASPRSEIRSVLIVTICLVRQRSRTSIGSSIRSNSLAVRLTRCCAVICPELKLSTAPHARSIERPTAAVAATVSARSCWASATATMQRSERSDRVFRQQRAICYLGGPE
jgi:hypothetical protein